MSEAVPKVLGRYEIEREIGRGMMGVVYRAYDPALGRTVALKTVRLAFAIPEGDDHFEKRFLTEARVAAALSHPGIVVVHDVGRDPKTGTLFIALEYLEGRSLSQITADGGPMDWREALHLVSRIADALHHAHAHGIVHRDIKPANVMVLPSGEPKIMDFGIAKVPAAQLTAAGEFFGTPLYMSPEQARGEPVDGRSDLFSLGSILYLLLTGRRAFEAANVPAILARVAGQDPPLPSSLVPGLPPEVDYVVSRALAKDRDLRYPDGRTLAEDIEDLLAERPPRHRSAPKPRDEETTWVALAAAAEPEPAGREPTGVLIRLSDRIGRRGFIALGALAAAGLLLSLLLPRGTASRATPAAPASAPASPEAGETPEPGSRTSLLGSLFGKEPAHLELVFEHSLRSGTLKVWVDDAPVLEEKLASRVVKRIGPVRVRRGTLRKVLDVAPGEHVIRVQVQGDDFSGTSRIKGGFESGATRRLDVNKEGLPLLKKELSLEWS